MKHLFAILTATVLLAACSSSDDAPILPTVQFPAMQTINCHAGDTPTLAFTASASWKLTSSATWCRFIDGESILFSLSGGAGSQSVTLCIGDESLSHEDATTALLTIHMGGLQSTLAEVTRSAAGYELSVYDADGNQVDYITAGYGEYATFHIKANFAFAATSVPDWAELRGSWMTGTAGEMTEGALRIIPDGSIEKYEQEGVITFQDANNKAKFNIRVLYDGMDREAIGITLPSGNAWSWTVSADGTTWKHDNDEYTAFVPTTISAYHDDYEAVYIEDTADGYAIDGVDGHRVTWMHINHATGRVTVDATEQERSGYIMVFPRALYNTVSADLQGALVTTENGRPALTYTYTQNNLVMAIHQKGVNGGGGSTSDETGFIALTCDAEWASVEVQCHRITDAALLAHCEEAIGTREVYLLDYRTERPGGIFDQVIPYPYIEDYNAWNSELATFGDPDNPETQQLYYFADDNGVRMDERGLEASFSDSTSPSYWYVMGCHNTDEPMFLVILNLDGSIMKALYIKTKQ